MTHRTLDYEERLRHALRAAAESVEPEGDGLERIRARIATPRHAPAAWMAASAEPSGPRIGPALRAFRDSRAVRWLFPAADGGSPSPYRWLRPVAAMAAFVLILGSGALALTNVSTGVVPASSKSSTGQPLNVNKDHGQPAGKGQQVNGGGSSGGGSSAAPAPAPSAGSSQGQGQGQASSPKPKPTPSASCSKTPGPSASAGPPEASSPPPSESPSPSPSSPSTSPDPTPSPTNSSGTTTPSTPSASSPEASATVVGSTTSATPNPTPKKHRPQPCS